MLRFAKILGHARPPEKLNINDPGLTLFSGEDFKVGHGEVHAFRTGIMIEIPEGSFGLLLSTHSNGVAGAIVCGDFLSPNDVGEVRVSIANLKRDAFEVKAGAPLCQLVVVPGADKVEGEAEEYDREGLTNEMTAAADEAKQESKKLKDSDKKK